VGGLFVRGLFLNPNAARRDSAGAKAMNPLGMAKSAQQEGFGDGVLLAIAGAAGCATAQRRPDDDSVDWTLSCRLSFRPKIDVQVKTWIGDDHATDPIKYPLKAKNYNDLVPTDLMAPRILVLVTIPHESKDWIGFEPSAITCRHSVFWVTLAGEPESPNTSTVTVSIPRKNILTVQSLMDLMEKVNNGDPL
jgi:hypothetical protein